IWIIRHNSDEIEEIKGDRQPIGKHSDPYPFSEHSLQLGIGDLIYIFTDGFSDQFGGIKGKKYKSSRLKGFLLSIKDMDISTQKILLEKEFANWRRDYEQIDDVCIIGLKV